jgi:dTDP-4-amino-4,6-dideoxygalactose transaminase
MLPTAHSLVPYLDKIDQTRVYSNFGPLVASLEERLGARFGLSCDMVTTVANGTLGLTLALAAQEASPGTLCVLPAWTFIASAHASTMAGLRPFFVDVDPRTWALDPLSLMDVISRAPGQVGAVMPVAPFGQPFDVAAWDDFRATVRLPVVIDAAAGFDSLTPGETPVVVSLHATKVLGVGEGGFVISTDPSLIRRIRTTSNFGFQGARDALFSAINAKLSEYHAAVAHAALDEWTEARPQWMAAARCYQKQLSRTDRVRFQDGFGHSWISSTCVLTVVGTAAHVETALSKANIATRRWWGAGAHAHPATRKFPRSLLPSTEALATTTIAVPLYRDLECEEILRIGEIILAATAD